MQTALPPGPAEPGIWQTIRYTFDQPGSFAKARARFGKTFTIRMPGYPPIIITADRDAIRALFTGDPLTKRHGNDVLRPFLGDRSVIVLEPAEHLVRRRIELPAFHGESIRTFSDRIRELAEEMVSGWPAGETVAVAPSARRMTLDVILELVLGVRDRSLRERLTAGFDSLVDSRAANLGQFMPPWMTRKSWWNMPGRVMHGRVEGIRRLLEAHAAATRADPELERRADVLALLVRARDEDGSSLSDADLRDELLTLVAAGHETTATVIAWSADLLAHHPDVADRLRETLAAGDSEYLKATAKEVLRARSGPSASWGSSPTATPTSRSAAEPIVAWAPHWPCSSSSSGSRRS